MLPRAGEGNVKDIQDAIKGVSRAIRAGDTVGAERLARTAVAIVSEAGGEVNTALAVASKLALASSLLAADKDTAAWDALAAVPTDGPAIPSHLRTEISRVRGLCLMKMDRYQEAIDELAPLARPQGPPRWGDRLARVNAFLRGTRKPSNRVNSFYLIALGIAYWRTGDLDNSEKCLLHWLKKFGRVHPRIKVHQLMCRSTLASIKVARGDLPGARQIYNEMISRGLDLEEASAGDMIQLAEVASALGEKKASTQWCEKAISAIESLPGRPPDRLARVYNRVGICYLSLGEPVRAETEFRKELALESDRQVSDDRGQAIVFNNIGVALRDQGRLTEALSYLNDALALLEKTPQSDSGLLANTVANIGTVEHRLGHQQAAERAFSRALAVVRGDLNDRHPTRKKVEQSCRELGYA